MFSRASDDVKLSLILDSLPKLSVKKILADMNESEKEVKTRNKQTTVFQKIYSHYRLLTAD